MIEITEQEKQAIKELVQTIDEKDFLEFKSLRELVKLRLTDPYLNNTGAFESVLRLVNKMMIEKYGGPFKEVRAKKIENFIKENPTMNRKRIAIECRLKVSTVNSLFYKLGIKSNTPRSITSIETEKELKKTIKQKKTSLCVIKKVISDKKPQAFIRKGINKIVLLDRKRNPVKEIEILPEFSLELNHQEKKELLYQDKLTPEEVDILKDKIVDVNLMFSKIISEELGNES